MPFTKGQSGNPGGRPKVAPEVRELARDNAPDAIQRLVQLMRSSDERVSIAACNAVLDRAWGRPTQAVEVDAAEPLQVVIKNYRLGRNGGADVPVVEGFFEEDG